MSDGFDGKTRRCQNVAKSVVLELVAPELFKERQNAKMLEKVQFWS